MDGIEIRKNAESVSQDVNGTGQIVGVVYHYPGNLHISDTYVYSSPTATDPSQVIFGALTSGEDFYKVSLSSASGLPNTPVTVTYTFDRGFPANTQIVPSCYGLSGSFASNILSPATGATSVSTTFTPTNYGYGVFYGASNVGLGNPAGARYATSAAGTFTQAIAYTLSFSAPALAPNVPVTLTYTSSDGGVFANNTVITPSVSGVTGMFNPSTVSPNGTSGTTVFTPTSVGTAVFTSTNNQSILNPGSVSKAVAPRGYTAVPSTTDWLKNTAVTIALAMADGTAFPNATTITPSVSGVAGTFSPTTVTPANGATTASVTFMPTAIGNAVVSFADDKGLGDPSNITATVANPPLAWPALNLATVSGQDISIPPTKGAGAGSAVLPSDFTEIQWKMTALMANCSSKLSFFETSTPGAPSTQSTGNDVIGRFSVVAFFNNIQIRDGTVNGSNGYAPKASKEIAVNDTVSILRSGNDATIRHSSDSGATWTTIGTATGAFTGNPSLAMQVLLNEAQGDNPQTLPNPAVIYTIVVI
jgi:hypothetical protein